MREKLLTLAEYLENYASAETKGVGYALIEHSGHPRLRPPRFPVLRRERLRGCTVAYPPSGSTSAKTDAAAPAVDEALRAVFRDRQARTETSVLRACRKKISNET